MADGFLGRWARRKQEVREGRPLEEPPTTTVRPEPVEGPPEHARDGLRQAQPERREVTTPVQANAPATPPDAPLPTMQDVQALTAESDFKPFVARSVDPEVRNAAMKKLFADPHYNVMDGLDIYIDDYSKPDPLPESMLRQMASAKFLNLFDDDKKDAAPQELSPTPEPAQPADPPITTQDHAHTDLRLQQDHAAGAPGSGGGAE